MVELLALLLLVSLWSLVYYLVIGNRWNSSSCSSVLGCSWCLVTYPAACWWMKQMARVWLWKGYIWCSLALPGRQLLLVTLVTHCVCVLHAHSLVCCLVVCVCKSSLGLVLWRDQLGSFIISPSFQLFANLPSGFATWLNDLVVVYVCRYQVLIRMNSRSSGSKNSWRSQCSLGHLDIL